MVPCQKPSRSPSTSTRPTPPAKLLWTSYLWPSTTKCSRGSATCCQSPRRAAGATAPGGGLVDDGLGALGTGAVVPDPELPPHPATNAVNNSTATAAYRRGAP